MSDKSIFKMAIKNKERLDKQIDDLHTGSEKAVKSTISDMRSRAPAWVAAEVVKVYNIKKKEIVPAKTEKSKKPVGSIRLKGDTVDALQLVYRGRMLTPVHFGMTPKRPNDGGSQTLKAEIIKGQRKVLGKTKKITKKQRKNIGRNFQHEGTRNSPKSPWMLRSTGANSEDKVQAIPFQRQKQPGTFDHVFKSISLPQMVSSDRTKDNISKALADGMADRLDRNMDRFIK